MQETCQKLQEIYKMCQKNMRNMHMNMKKICNEKYERYVQVPKYLWSWKLKTDHLKGCKLVTTKKNVMKYLSRNNIMWDSDQYPILCSHEQHHCVVDEKWHRLIDTWYSAITSNMLWTVNFVNILSAIWRGGLEFEGWTGPSKRTNSSS